MTPLLANAGTPLMWLSMGHLVLGNIVLGYCEAWLLRVVLRVPSSRAVPRMIGANFASMLVGLLVLAMASHCRLDEVTPAAGRVWLSAAATAVFAVTVLAEWPFVAWAMPPAERRWKRALGGSLIAQTASYAVLVPLYLNVSSFDVLTQTTPTDAPIVAKANDADVYYLATDGKSVWRVGLDGRDRRQVAEVADGGGKTRLWAIPERSVLRVAGASHADIAVPRYRLTRAPGEVNGWGDAADAGDGTWSVSTGFWPIQGLRASRRATGERLHFALETPLLSWVSRDATVLRDGVVVYQLGPHVVALDLVSTKLAVLAEGRCPVVAVAAP